MGSALVVGQLGFKKNFIHSMMSAQLTLPDFVWLRLLWSWSGFFAVMGGINLWVAFNYDTDTWVNYKLFGSMGLMFVFVLAQGVYLSRFIQPEAEQPPQEP